VRLVIVVAAVVASAACGVGNRARFDTARGEPVALMPPLASFTDRETVRRELGNPKHWRLRSDLARKGSWGAPAYRDAWVEVAGESLLGHEGILRLHFTNERLEGTWFYPVDEEALMRAVEQSLQTRFVRPKGHEFWGAKADPSVTLYAGLDGFGQFVSWYDRRLVRESDDWWTLFASGQQQWLH
jgi:hypothetical protein